MYGSDATPEYYSPSSPPDHAYTPTAPDNYQVDFNHYADVDDYQIYAERRYRDFDEYERDRHLPGYNDEDVRSVTPYSGDQKIYPQATTEVRRQNSVEYRSHSDRNHRDSNHRDSNHRDSNHSDHRYSDPEVRKLDSTDYTQNRDSPDYHSSSKSRKKEGGRRKLPLTPAQQAQQAQLANSGSQVFSKEHRSDSYQQLTSRGSPHSTESSHHRRRPSTASRSYYREDSIESPPGNYYDADPTLSPNYNSSHLTIADDTSFNRRGSRSSNHPSEYSQSKQPEYEQQAYEDRKKLHERSSGYERGTGYHQEAYGDQEAAYSDQEATYPGRDSTYPSRDTTYPGRDAAYPSRDATYPDPVGYKQQESFDDLPYDEQSFDHQRSYERRKSYERETSYDQDPIYDGQRTYEREKSFDRDQSYDRASFDQAQSYDCEQSLDQDYPDNITKQNSFDQPLPYEKPIPYNQQVPIDTAYDKKTTYDKVTPFDGITPYDKATPHEQAMLYDKATPHEQPMLYDEASPYDDRYDQSFIAPVPEDIQRTPSPTHSGYIPDEHLPRKDVPEDKLPRYAQGAPRVDHFVADMDRSMPPYAMETSDITMETKHTGYSSLYITYRSDDSFTPLSSWIIFNIFSYIFALKS